MQEGVLGFKKRPVCTLASKPGGLPCPVTVPQAMHHCDIQSSSMAGLTCATGELAECASAVSHL